MTRLRSALAASAAMATLVAALPALADGPSVSPVIYEPAEIVSEDDFWAGMYAGLFFGMGASSHELFIDIDGSDRFTHTEDGIGGTGALVGARGGFDFRFGTSGIFGVGLDASFGDISSSSTTLYRPVGGGQLEVTHRFGGRQKGVGAAVSSRANKYSIFNFVARGATHNLEAIEAAIGKPVGPTGLCPDSHIRPATPAGYDACHHDSRNPPTNH